MQHITKITSKILSITPTIFTAMFAIALVFGLVGTAKVEAANQSTYVVDVTGNGCGNNCAAFYNYLAANGISVSSNNSNTSNSSNNGVPVTNKSSTSVPVGQNGKAPSTSYVQYPYQVYTPFSSNGGTSGNTNGGTTTGSNGTTMGTINYVQYPYYAYQYFQNPAPKYDSYLSGQYPESNYVYYGKDATEQMNKYKKTYTSTTSANSYLTNSAGSNGGSGFTITSILK